MRKGEKASDLSLEINPAKDEAGPNCVTGLPHMIGRQCKPSSSVSPAKEEEDKVQVLFKVLMVRSTNRETSMLVHGAVAQNDKVRWSIEDRILGLVMNIRPGYSKREFRIETYLLSQLELRCSLDNSSRAMPLSLLKFYLNLA